MSTPHEWHPRPEPPPPKRHGVCEHVPGDYVTCPTQWSREYRPCLRCGKRMHWRATEHMG